MTGAIVRLTGSDTTMTTGPSGTFSFAGVIAGRVILTVAAPAYEFRSIPLELAADTVLTITMRLRTTSLDPMLVRPGSVKIKGSVLDSASGDAILFAQVTLFPQGSYVEASNSGRFTLDKVPTGPVMLVAEAVEHLPRTIQFDARRDTTVTMRLAIDSVAIRMKDRQVMRLNDRSYSQPYMIRSYNRQAIEQEGQAMLGYVIDRMMVKSPSSQERNARNVKSADEGCYFLDDKKVVFAVLDGQYPELVERVEIYGGGAMIRVYTKRYVLSLAGQPLLKKVTYIPTGMSVICE